MMKSTAIEGMRRFLKHAETLKPQNSPRRENGFAREFQEIKDLSSRLKKDPFYSTKHGEKDVNRPKNRYKDILPYDYSRIILPSLQGVEGSDYINGNYIKGPTDEVLYLAAQGPLPQTVNDFWRMIISHQTQVIVMACREYELGKLKCKRYWPENCDEKLTFNGFEVSLISQEEMGDGFIIRTLCAKHSKGELKVTQFHYTAWPDHDVPRSATPLIELTMSFRAFVGNDNTVPVLVHCSAGCGRTGTICALDYALTLIRLKRTEKFSVFEIVSNLRKQRIAMVQTKEQYELVYKAVKEIVSNELLKQRASMHTYVNVSVGEELPDHPSEQMYENVDFIRSIQRLHEEEKNAARKPRELPPSPHKPNVVASKKDNALFSEKKPLEPSKTTASQRPPQALPNQRQGQTPPNQRQPQALPNQRQDQSSANQSQDSSRKASGIQASAKPALKKKPVCSYENVLPLSAMNNKPPPPSTPKPQNYKNVVIGQTTSNENFSDYVNVPSSAAKSVPLPEKKSEPGDKTPKPVPVPSAPIKSAGKHVISEKEDDYVIPPLPRKIDKQLSPASSENIKQGSDGDLIDLYKDETELLPLRRSSSEVEVQSNKKTVKNQRSFDSALPTDLSRSSPAISSRESDSTKTHLNKPIREKKQPKTQQRISGQYSLVGALDGSGAPNGYDKEHPFHIVPMGHSDKQQEVPKPNKRSSFSKIESVVADSAPDEVMKPYAPPHCKNEESAGKKSDQPSPQENPTVGIYSMVDIPRNEPSSGLLIDLGETSRTAVSSTSSLNELPSRPVQKAYSTENMVNKNFDSPSSNEQPKSVISRPASVDSNLPVNLASVPSPRRRSEDHLCKISSALESGPFSSKDLPGNASKSGLYSSAGSYMPAKKASTEKTETSSALESGPFSSKHLPGNASKSGLYSSAGGYMPAKKSVSVVEAGPLSLSSDTTSHAPKQKAQVQRSNSGGPTSLMSSEIHGNFESLYATVGQKTKDRRRTPLKSDMWTPTKDPSPPVSLERDLRRSDHSSSSLRSVTSTSSNDSLEDAPPVPTKTSDAFYTPDDDDAYEAVQKSSSARSTLDRLKSRAKNMMPTGANVSKLSLGKRSTAHAHMASTDSLATGEGMEFDTSSFGKRVEKPVGARPCPSQWPKFPR